VEKLGGLLRKVLNWIRVGSGLLIGGGYGHFTFLKGAQGYGDRKLPSGLEKLNSWVRIEGFRNQIYWDKSGKKKGFGG